MEGCAFCERQHPQGLCGACRAVAYCGEACQRAHWKLEHFKVCGVPIPEELAVAEPPLALQRWGTLGSGRYGSVFRAYDEDTGQVYAAKIFRQETAGLREAAVLAKLQERGVRSKHVPEFFGLVDSAGLGGFALLTELIEGRNLETVRRQYEEFFGIRPWPKLVLVAQQLLKGLSFVHEQGVAHRDLKLDNVMLESKTERVVIVDFGVSCTAADNNDDDDDALWKRLECTDALAGAIINVAPAVAPYHEENLFLRQRRGNAKGTLYSSLPLELAQAGDRWAALLLLLNFVSEEKEHPGALLAPSILSDPNTFQVLQRIAELQDTTLLEERLDLLRKSLLRTLKQDREHSTQKIDTQLERENWRSVEASVKELTNYLTLYQVLSTKRLWTQLKRLERWQPFAPP